MKYYYINTGENTGKYNMDFDIDLAQVCKPGEFYLRFYKWNPYCISLGANQNYEYINYDRAVDDGLDIIKRPTGGRAILHSEELTYSVVSTVKDQKSAHNFYNEINKALRKGLIFYSDILNEIELESTQPDFPKIYSKKNSNACFSSTAKSELKFNGKKLVGSAQRKLGNNLLQHGSILCGSFHKKLADYLFLTEEETLELNKQLNFVTTDLNSILNEEIIYSKLEKSILKGFEEYFGINFEISSVNLFNKELSQTL